MAEADRQKVTLKRPKQAATEWRPKFLLALRNHANVRLACEVAGVARKTAYQARKNSAVFAAQWDEAEADACDTLEGIARMRAAASSDALLMFLLRAHRPERFRETIRHQHAGDEAKPVVLKIAREMTDDELAAIAAGGSMGIAVTEAGASKPD